MKVFLSWSGHRSRYLADALRSWLPRVIQSLQPWMSEEDIAAGSRWLPEISKELGEAKVGILCVTPENESNPWLIFEAGALSKTLDQPFVCPLLFDMSPSQLNGPLAQFQALSFDRPGIFRILTNLNNVPGHTPLPGKDLEEIFEVWWPRLEACLSGIPSTDSAITPKRTTEELLEEILSISREHLRRENLRLEDSRIRDEKLDKMIPIFEQMATSTEQMQRSGMAVGELFKKFPNSANINALMPSFDINKFNVHEMLEVIKDMSLHNQNITSELLSQPKPISET